MAHSSTSFQLGAIITKLSSWTAILFVLFGGAFLARAAILPELPPSPYWEEVALGYDAYSVLQTGKDHHGNPWPVVAFTSFGDYKPSGYFYAVIPSIALFGLNTWAVRFPALLASAATVALMAQWVKRATGSKNFGFWTGFVLLIQPWSWWIGKIGFEVNLATFLLILGNYALWETLQQEREHKAVNLQKFAFTAGVATVALASSMYTYHAMRLLAPLFALWIFVYEFPWSISRIASLKTLTRWIAVAVSAGLLVLPILLVIQNPEVQQRIQETSLFQNPEPILRSNELRSLTGFSLLSNILFHRVWFWGAEVLQNWLSHFTLGFLFINGDGNPRHSSQYLGMLAPWEVLSLLLGLLATKKLKRAYGLFLGLLFLSPVAAAFTLATPHALRALPLSVFFAVFSGVGVSIFGTTLFNLSKKYPIFQIKYGWHIFSTIAAILLISTLPLWFYMKTQYIPRYAQEWQYGYQQLIAELRQAQKPGEKIFVSRKLGRPAMYVWFFEKTDPRLVQKEESTAPKDQAEFLQWQEWSFHTGANNEAGLHAVAAEEFATFQVGKENILKEVLDPQGRVIWIIYRNNSL